MSAVKRPSVLCAVAALLLLTGCWLGDRFFTARTVAVNFPAPAGQNTVALSVDDTRVQGALRVIDAVLTSQGFHQGTNAPAQNEQGLVVGYTRYTGQGPTPLDVGPTVYLKTNRLEVVVMEWGNRSGHLSTEGKRLCKSLRDELSKRYGKVRIER
jgi:hypothetical protein